MAKARNFVERARRRGVIEGEAKAAEAVKRSAERPAPTIIHTEPKVDTSALAKEMGALAPLLTAIAEKEAQELDVSAVVEAISSGKFDDRGLVKAISAVAAAVSEQSTVLERLQEFEAAQNSVVEALNQMIEVQSKQTEAMQSLTEAYRAPRVLKFTDGGATLEAK